VRRNFRRTVSRNFSSFNKQTMHSAASSIDKRPGLLADTLDVLASNEWLVIFNLRDAVTRYLLIIRLAPQTRSPIARAATNFSEQFGLVLDEKTENR
jgi:hypothetical protein